MFFEKQTIEYMIYIYLNVVVVYFQLKKIKLKQTINLEYWLYCGHGSNEVPDMDMTYFSKYNSWNIYKQTI